MLEALQRSAPVIDTDKLEEDEAMIKKYCGSRKVVKRINDDDLEDDCKRRKVSSESSWNATDFLTKGSGSDKKTESKDGSYVFNSTRVKVHVVKKLPHTSYSKKPELVEVEEQAPDAKVNKHENATCGSSYVLRSLCRQYDSEDDDE